MAQRCVSSSVSSLRGHRNIMTAGHLLQSPAVLQRSTFLTASTCRSAHLADRHATRHAILSGWVHGERRQRHALQRPGAFADVLAAAAESPYRNAASALFSVLGALALVKFFKTLATREVIDQKLSRKLVHTTSGPLFVLTWVLFSADPSARFLAAAVPLLNFLRLFAVGSGILEDRGLVMSVSRSGDRSELLKGPLYYCIVLIAVALLCWRDNPSGIIAISLMCGGDGLADIVGRRFGQAKLPYNSSKSWAGSMAMFSGGTAMSLGLIYVFCSLGFFPCYTPGHMLPYVAGIALAATVVESLPINQVLDDNISVPLVSLGFSALLMPYLTSSACLP